MSGWNLALRFGLELACLTGIGIAGWLVSPLVAVAGVVVAAAAWGIFAVPGDPSRSGNAPVAVPGWLRLLLELTVFLGGAAAWGAASHPAITTAILLLLVVHHAAARRRLVWLLRQPAT